MLPRYIRCLDTILSILSILAHLVCLMFSVVCIVIKMHVLVFQISLTTEALFDMLVKQHVRFAAHCAQKHVKQG